MTLADNKMVVYPPLSSSKPSSLPIVEDVKSNGKSDGYLSQNLSNSHATKRKNKNKNNPSVIIKFSVLFKILVLILKKEVHFLVFSFSVRL